MRGKDIIWRLKIDGNNPYSHNYAVCKSPKGVEIGSVTTLIDLEEKSKAGCANTQIPELELELEPEPDLEEGMVNDVEALPSNFNWRTRPKGNYLTKVKNQGGCGSCWAFASVGVTEAALNIANNRTGNNFDLSEQYMVSNCLSKNNCCGGWPEKALQYIRDKGIPNEGCMKYKDGGVNGIGGCSCSNNTCDSKCKYKNNGQCSEIRCGDKCGSWSRQLTMVKATGAVGSTRYAIKNKLVNNGPLTAYIRQRGTFDSKTRIYKCTQDSPTTHGVVIVGYNDSGKYWIVRNSWGGTWNGDGYYKVGYGECSIESRVHYATQSGFDSKFTSSSKGWAKYKGSWNIQSGNYLTTLGVKGKYSSVSYNGQYYPLTYEVRMKRNGCPSCANHVSIRGAAYGLDSMGRWQKEYKFAYTNNGYFSVWKKNKSSITAKKNWTYSTAIKKNNWNVIKIKASGSKLRFYINGSLVWAGSDTSFKSGRVGIGMYRNTTTTGNKLLVDWAKLTKSANISAPERMQNVGKEAPGNFEDSMSP